MLNPMFQVPGIVVVCQPFTTAARTAHFMWAIQLCMDHIAFEPDMLVTPICKFKYQGEDDIGSVTIMKTAATEELGTQSHLSEILEAGATEALDQTVSKGQIATTSVNDTSLRIRAAIDFTAWKQPQSEEIDGLGVDDRHSVTARVGEFTNVAVTERYIFRGTGTAIIGLAGSMDRSREMPHLHIILEHNLKLDAHPRPGSVALPSFLTAVNGLAAVPVEILRQGRFFECNFVVFENRQPVLDGWLRTTSPPPDGLEEGAPSIGVA